MAEKNKAQKLTSHDLDIDLPPSDGLFNTTRNLSPLDDIVGQPRAIKALELGLDVNDSGYNIYASGMSGLGKRTMLQKILQQKAEEKPVPSDWIYVNNFDQQDRPPAFEIQPGKARELKRDIKELIEQLKEELPKAFQKEDFSNEKKRLNQHYRTQARKLFQELQQSADEIGFVIDQSPDGRVMIIPKKDDRAMKSEEFDSLKDEEKEQIEKKQQELAEKANKKMGQQREIERKLREDIRNIERDFAQQLFGPAIDSIVQKYPGEKLKSWLGQMKEHMLDNLQQFQDKGEQNQNPLAVMMGGGGTQDPQDPFEQYDINIVVDNSETDHAPFIMETSPNYKNLFGTIHGISDRMGRMITNFRQINAGSILRANGGYLMFDLVEALIEPLVWKELKRTIKSGVLEYHMYDPFGVFSSSAMRPEPIPIKLKIVAYGNPLIYYLLQLYDEDFAEIFKVKADFAGEMELQDTSLQTIGKFISKLQQKEDGVMPFDREGVYELLRQSIRMAGDKEKVSTAFKQLEDLARESTYWAKKDNAAHVSRTNVRKAIDEKIFRSNLIADKMSEMIAKGTLLISTEGAAVGQINGLSVIALGDYMFGRPTRLTSSIGVGNAGIINIERESKLSGRTYDKSMMILEGFLRNTYSTRHSLSLSASLAMEQSYGMIEGDSASVAELLCLLSACAGVPMRQDIAVTGSVNQWGQVQAIGGVNAKIEGFYDICKIVGLTGNQGVCVPKSNIRNIVLRPDVIEAVKEEQFHVWAVNHVDEALELFSGVPSGSIDEEHSFHWRVDQRLIGMLELLNKQKAAIEAREMHVLGSVDSPKQPDPRPPLPGNNE
ncbi:MAG: AAA family ATPase [Chitinivibrionales bacterium]|nr:AAA family ATPase [Chitinivibrionales bacterium]